ncbi:cation:proton antiporter [Maribacter arenosus]|uniref:Cation:proton antiporter n=1 Tax=Maribacter arenosus TaxID=1854708 RepID=A0ABR7VC29_9FLAO|nr:cation:proton antiporter [Maribacter arenosus]MBD0850077.1 cation:proton antiporter [Maribacter arenosus]
MKILSISLDPTIAFLSILAILIILVGLFLKRLKQPYIIGYILVGALLGKDGLGFIEDTATINHLGEIGIILLLFFIGMEISLPEFIKQWKVAAVGTFLQVGASVLILLGIGFFFDWQFKRSIIIGFIIALSSSAVIIKLLADKNLVNTRIGKNVLSILLMQDIIIVPLLIITSLLGGKEEPLGNLLLMLVGGIVIIIVLMYIYQKKNIVLPFSKNIENDHELQVFLAIFFCFGGALISSFFGLSAALGAFVGGLLMHASKATKWIYDTLDSFRVLFVALFFVSVGLQLDFDFVYQNAAAISAVIFSVYVTNHLINSLILRIFSSPWREAVLGGAFLAQIGELSFLLGFSAFNLGIIEDYTYKFMISLISLTLIISPFWITLTERLIAFQRIEKIKRFKKTVEKNIAE